MRRIKLTVSYDGTNYSGWQIQPNSDTIENQLDVAINKLTKENIHVIGASRTDAGVHAMGNVAVFDTESSIPPDRFCYALNANLPKDIVVQESCEVNLEFHPRHCNTKKTYEYRILNTHMPVPQLNNYSWHVSQNLDISAMKKAASYLIGEHDFKSFCCVRTQAESTIRTIYEIDIIKPVESEVVIRVTGNGFLYNMVRIIAGTLAYVGQGKIKPEDVFKILESRERSNAGKTAPPQGLTLVRIDYLDGDDVYKK